MNRRNFGKTLLGSIPLASAALAGQELFGAAKPGAQAGGLLSGVLNRRGAGCTQGDFNSKIAGVQIGVIAWYSYRQMPIDVRSLLTYMTENGINACELECGAAEPFAGAPAAAAPFGGRAPGGRGRGPAGAAGGRRGGRAPLTPAQQAARQAARQAAAAALTKWRLSAPMTKFEEIRRMYAYQGVRIYGFKLEPASAAMPDAEFDYAFNVAKALGAGQVTMEMPGSGGRGTPYKPDDALTKRIGAIAAKHKIMVGYHAHTQADATLWDTAMSQSPYNGINLDVGHYVAAGNHDVLEFIRKNHERITSIHLKDRHYPNQDNGANTLWGQGDTPIKQILQLMRDQKYSMPGTIELEYPIPQGSNPVIEAGRCFAYAKDVLLRNGPDSSAST